VLLEQACLRDQRQTEEESEDSERHTNQLPSREFNWNPLNRKFSAL
jgi:hypothetical protein